MWIISELGISKDELKESQNAGVDAWEHITISDFYILKISHIWKYLLNQSWVTPLNQVWKSQYGDV